MKIFRVLGALVGACLAWSTDAAEPVDAEAFQAAVPKNFSSVTYPPSQLNYGGEGWVEVNFMIDPAGKPYEISVSDSTGVPAFEEAAVQAVERSTFKPARLGNRTIDSSMNIKVKFSMRAWANKARKEFAATYGLAVAALDAGDRAKVDELLPKLTIHNLYEDVYRNLVLARYAQKWGTGQEERDALKRAIAGESRPVYLEKSVYVQVLNHLLQAQLKTLDLGGALKTWQQIRNLKAKDSIAQWQDTMTKVAASRAEPGEVRMPGKIARNSWFVELFKNRFSIEVSSGRIADIKLRCQKQYLLFRYEPGVRYELKGNDGDCSLELVGEPGTTFELVQS